MAFGDADGIISILTQVDDDNTSPFNGFEGQAFEWPDTPAPLPDIDWTDSTPLNSIGMPHYKTQLLSSWDPSFAPSNPYFPPPQKIPLQILNTMKTNDNVAYATLPKELRGKRNVIPASQRKTNGRFRSGKVKASDVTDSAVLSCSYSRRNSKSPTHLSLIQEMISPRTIAKSRSNTPNLVLKTSISGQLISLRVSQYSHDRRFFNKTEYSGLETHILNSYTNSMLQAMCYIRPISRLAKSHIATDCNREHCLLCELGFVVRMLEDARGTNCQASNFCKTVGVLAQGLSLSLYDCTVRSVDFPASNKIDLIDYGRETEVDHSHIIQSFHRFLVDHLSSEGNAFPHNPVLLKPPGFVPDPYNPAAAPITQLMGIDAKNIITCVHCKAVRTKENVTHIIELIYPRKVL